jgi:hypothetical protein
MIRIRRDRAYEQRFVIDSSLAAEILSWVRPAMAPDPHGSGPAHDSYVVNTTYFDTADLATYRRSGSAGRAKYRIRRYGVDDTLFLERKLRTSATLVKWRSSVSTALTDDLECMGHPDAAWFTRRLAVRRLQPVCGVRYSRVARQTISEAGISRLTLDANVRGGVSGAGAASSWSCQVPLVGDAAILELKYQHHAPPLFRNLVERFSLMSTGAVSKYRRAVEMLDLGAQVRQESKGECR